MKGELVFVLYGTVLSLMLACNSATEESHVPPNVIYILADDLGYGDISLLNRDSKIKTPNIDNLGKRGVAFTDAHSGSAVCTPTRYGILTGRYAWRTRLQNGVTWSWDQPLIDRNRFTVADLLKKKGYKTACVGKWHLGLGWQQDAQGNSLLTKPLMEGPNDLGFDYFFGITASLDIPPYVYIENDRSTSQQIDTIEARTGKEFWRKGPIGHDFKHEEVLPKLTEVSCRLIAEYAAEDDPFFIYFPLPAPHTPILPTEKYLGKSGTNAYGDFVLQVDDVVGAIVETLEAHQIAENTIIIFTSDNGCSPKADFEELAELDHDPSHIFRGHKADIFEGGHRVPYMIQWPREIIGGREESSTICLTDLMATLADITGESLSDAAGVDSYSHLGLLKGVKSRWMRPPVVHHSINGSFALRSNQWKVNFCPGSGGWSDPRPKKAREEEMPSTQLYDLVNDPGELQNIAEEEPQRVAQMTEQMQEFIDLGRSTRGSPQPNEVEVKLRTEE